jgi:hypothetical protein
MWIRGQLAAWIKRRGMDEVRKALAPEESSDPAASKRKPIQFLRQYSNYLTPQLGISSRDTWAMISIYLRNMLLNVVILTAFLTSVLLVPRCALWVQKNWGAALASNWGLSASFAMGGWVLAVVLVHLCGFSCEPYQEHDGLPEHKLRFRHQSSFDFWIVLPLLAATVLTSGRIWHIRREVDLAITGNDRTVMLWIGAALLAECFGALLLPLLDFPRSAGTKRGLCFHATAAALLWPAHLLLITIGWSGVPRWVFISGSAALAMWYLGWRGGFLECFLQARRTQTRARKFAWGAIAALFLTALAGVGGFGAGLTVKGLAALFTQWESTPWAFTVLAVPLLLASLSLVSFLYMGLLGANFPDERREWISRLVGRLLLAGIFWLVIFGCAFYITPFLDSPATSKLLKNIPVKWTLGTIWAAITGLSVKAAHSANTGASVDEPKTASVPFSDWIAKVGPYVFIAGMLAAVSLLISSVLGVWDHASVDTNWFLLGQSGELWNAPVWQFLPVSVLIMTILSFTVDVNEFSMHHFYRNRLVRCYLGASNGENRRPDRFTGFDSRDDVSLKLFAPSQTTPGIAPYLGPYPILNTALNFTTGENLAYQERQAESFIFTPRYSGVDCEALNFNETGVRPAYWPTGVYAYPMGGIHIGSAMAISGAAMSPIRAITRRPQPRSC